MQLSIKERFECSEDPDIHTRHHVENTFVRTLRKYHLVRGKRYYEKGYLKLMYVQNKTQVTVRNHNP